jgi:hypothetical protein
MLIALLFWYLESLQHRQTGASQFFVAIFSDVPQALNDPSVTLVDGGNTIELHLTSSLPGHARVITTSPATCGGPAFGNYETQSAVLNAGKESIIRCTPTRPPRSITFTKREMAIGMIRPVIVAPFAPANMVPAHQLRVAVAQRAVDAAEFEGGLAQALMPSAASVPSADDATNVRFLSRYGAAYEPSTIVTWTDYWAEIFWAAALVAIAVLIVLFGNALYAILTAT